MRSVVSSVNAALCGDKMCIRDRHDARRLFLGLLEQVAHARRALADEHLHELGARDGEERHVRLARDGLRQQRFTGARRAYEQHALRHRRADGAVFFRGVQEVDDLRQCLLGLCLLYTSRCV